MAFAYHTSFPDSDGSHVGVGIYARADVPIGVMRSSFFDTVQEAVSALSLYHWATGDCYNGIGTARVKDACTTWKHSGNNGLPDKWYAVLDSEIERVEAERAARDALNAKHAAESAKLSAKAGNIFDGVGRSAKILSTPAQNVAINGDVCTVLTPLGSSQWSAMLRARVAESEAKRKAQEPQVLCQREFENWE